MNTILLQKILDILTEGLAHVGNFFKDLFVSDPQDGQVIAYDAESGHWINQDACEVELDLTKTFEDQAIATLPDSANNVPMKSLTVNIMPKETGTGTKSPDNPYVISGTDTVTITQTDEYEQTIATYTIALGQTVYGGVDDVASGNGTETQAKITFDGSSDEFWSSYLSRNGFYINIPDMATSNGEIDYSCNYLKVTSDWEKNLGIRYGANNKFIYCLHITDNLQDVTDVATWRTYLSNNPLVLTYPLATPTPISTTPIQIKTTGYDNVSADCGDVSGEYYTAAADPVIALANITEDITSEVTKNTTDFSDILLKVSRNNKVVSIEIYNATTAAAVNDTFLSNLPKPAMNCKVLLVNTTLGEDGTILGTLKTSGELGIATSGAKSFSGLITYVSK